MIPVLTPAEVAQVDAAATEPVDVLIERAGAAVARVAVSMLGGAYGRRVVVLAGPGNNGADGRVAARRLAARGVGVEVVEATESLEVGPADLYIDAAFGTGLSRGYEAPLRADPRAPVLAVDIPSGVDGLTGQVVADGRPWAADRTVTFAALRAGLLLEPGRGLAGAVTVADIGLATDVATIHMVEATDVGRWVPIRPPDTHKWRSACRIVAGAPSMPGAAHLAARAAMRAGAGYVQLGRPGAEPGSGSPSEVVGLPLPGHDWSSAAADGLDRVSAVLVGPGLGRDPATGEEVARLLGSVPVPVVLDADGLVPEAIAAVQARSAPTVLTPHDGEMARIGGDASDPDRIGATCRLADSLGATVLRKGPTTVVAEVDGRVRIVADADARLATAGTGDVLSGLIVGLIAAGAAPADAAAAAAQVHALAARRGRPVGLVAGDLPVLAADVLSELMGRPDVPAARWIAQGEAASP